MKNGFTLMELLVALVVFGLLMVGLSQGMRMGLKAWDLQAGAVSETAELDAVDRALRNLLSRIDAGGGQTLARLKGDAHHFEFAGDLPQAAALDDRHADMALMQSGNRLVLGWTPHRHEVPIGGPPAPQVETLLRGIETIQFAYWHPPDASGAGAGWHDDWTDNVPPQLIRLRITFPKGDRRHWPDLMIAPMVEPGG